MNCILYTLSGKKLFCFFRHCVQAFEVIHLHNELPTLLHVSSKFFVLSVTEEAEPCHCGETEGFHQRDNDYLYLVFEYVKEL